MKTEKTEKRFTIHTLFHLLCVAILIGFLLFTVFHFPNAFGRIVEGVRDFGNSVAYFFCEMCGLPFSVIPTVNQFPQLDFFFPFLPRPNAPAPSTPLPDTIGGFQSAWVAYWQTWASLNNFFGYLSLLGNVLYWLCLALMIAVPLCVVVFKLFNRILQRQNNDYNKDSRPLKLYKRFSKKVALPVVGFILAFAGFVKEHKPYRMAWLLVWLFNFNVFTIALEFFAFYFYLVASLDFISIYRQVYKLFLDLSAPLTFIPLWAWAIVALVLLNKFRKNIAYMRLNHMEMKNRGFINGRPIVVMDCGTMGKKKTTMITDMVLSQEVMFRDKAFEKILENDLKFPYFPWINFENALKKAMEKHSVYDLATCRRFVKSKRLKFFRRPLPYLLFGYDFDRYSIFYDDKLKVVDLWEVLETYAQLYFIYIIQSSLLVSNYSIRVDGLLADLGNFPMWNSDFFHRDSRLIDSFSRHSHILDFDMLRLGRKVIEQNPNKDAFDFGVVVITEVGKERGNTVENKEVKKSAYEANQKNDLFNTALKMIRHPATVDNFPFVKVITDEQRPSSWGADARELCEIVHIRDSGETRLAMPFFTLEELLYSWVFGKFVGLYHEYRFNRGDNTLSMYLFKSVTAAVQRYYTRTYNLFSFCPLTVQIESGTLDGQFEEHSYYLMSKKIYAKRFATDCYSEFFTAKALRSPTGLNDLAEYQTEKATFDELELQHSYFIDDLMNMEKTEKER